MHPRRTVLRPAFHGLLLMLGWLAAACLAAAPAQAAAPKSAPSGVYYEIFVRSWYDTNGDGIGDLNGVTAKLDYLQSLGVSGIWLMPINPSPSYHGYDITDYYGINPQYGTMADFERLVRAAHARGIKIILDLVINHTSDRHPWFKAARDPASPYHAWYSWSRQGTDLHAVSATGSPAWHALGRQHYEGTFTAEMPDLNYDTPAVRAQMIELGRYWLGKGADGFRLDAAQHIYYDFQSQKNDPAVLAKNLAWWTQFSAGIATAKPHAYVVGEVTRDDPRELAPYFGPLSAVFDFPLAKQLIASANSGRDDGLGRLLERTESAYRQATGRSGVDAPFLSNHDQERVMSQLGGNLRHMRSAAAMLLTLPGHPFVYYGEELGMRGEKPDPDLREPMRWHRDPHGPGETRWKNFSAGDGPDVTVAAEQAQPASLLHEYITLIGWRRQIGALRDGALRNQPFANPHIVAWQLQDAHGRVLVVHNLADTPQNLTLDDPSLQSFRRIDRSTDQGATLVQGRLRLPPGGSVILD